MVLVKMLMKIGPPTMRGSLVMSMAPISPSRREVSPAESLRRRAKVLLPKFRLEMVAHHPKSLLLIFSRANWLIYQKMGTGGWPGAPQATRARLGGRRTQVACGAPVGLLLLPRSFLGLFPSRKNRQKVSLHLDFIWYGFSGKPKTSRKQQMALGTRSIC
jgi:hypothetical protein